MGTVLLSQAVRRGISRFSVTGISSSVTLVWVGFPSPQKTTFSVSVDKVRLPNRRFWVRTFATFRESVVSAAVWAGFVILPKAGSPSTRVILTHVVLGHGDLDADRAQNELVMPRSRKRLRSEATSTVLLSQVVRRGISRFPAMVILSSVILTPVRISVTPRKNNLFRECG